MPDTIVEDEFARFAQEYGGTFRPVPVDAMPGWRRHRRRGVAWLGGLAAALVLALTANMLQPASPAPPDRVIERTVRLEGARGSMSVQFVDARHGWVVFSDCDAEDRCAVTVGRTTDAGRSWARVRAPDLPERGRPALFATGRDSAFIGIGTSGRGADTRFLWWETDDGGRSFHATTVAAADAVNDSHAYAPIPGPYASGEARTGNAEGQWKIRRDDLVTHVYYSPQGRQDWRELPTQLPAGAVARASAGGEAWAFSDMPNRAWRLTPRDAVEVPGFPASAAIGTAAPIGDGGVVITVPAEGSGVWRDGRFTPFPAPMVRAFFAVVLDDGTLALFMPPGEGEILGAEGGPWVHLRPPYA